MKGKRHRRPTPRSRTQLFLEPLDDRICPSGLPPVAVDDTYTIHQGTTLNVNAPGPLANDTDNEQDPLTAEIYSWPSHAGYFYLNNDGSFDYYPSQGFVGTDAFQYRAHDGSSFSNIATVTINVTNQAPVANPDAYTVSQGVTLSINAPGVLANDTDGNDDNLSAVIYSYPSHAGYFFLSSDGSFVYYSTGSFTGEDSFQYRAFDSAEYSDPVTVTLTVVRTVTWDGGGDGIYWHDPLNWNIDQVPSAFDNVVIATTGTIVHVGGNTTVHSLHSDADLDWTGSLTLSAASAITGEFNLDGALTLQDGVTLDLSGGGSLEGSAQLNTNSELNLASNEFFFTNFNATGDGPIVVSNGATFTANQTENVTAMSLEGGTINGSGALNISNNLTWTSGSIGTAIGPNPEVVIQTGATLAMTGPAAKTMTGSNLTIATGATAYLSGGSFSFGGAANAATVTNQGTFELRGDNLSIGQNGLTSFVNQGTFRKFQSQANDMTTIDVTFENPNGTVRIDTGVLNFSLTYFQYGVDSLLAIPAGTQVRGESMEIAAGTVSGAGRLTVGSGAGGELIFGNATMLGTRLEVSTNSTLRISSTVFNAVFDHAQIVNDGLVRWVSGPITMKNQASIQNNGGATFRIESNNNGMRMSDLTLDCTFTNSGTLVKTQGTGTDIIEPTLHNIPVPNFPTPLVEVDAGTIQYEGDGGTHTANFVVELGSVFSFAGTQAINNFQGTSTFNGGLNGRGTVIVSGLTFWNRITLGTGAHLTFNTDLQIGDPNDPQVSGEFTGAGEVETTAAVNCGNVTLRDLAMFRNRGQMALTRLTTIDSSVLRNQGIVSWTGMMSNIQLGTLANLNRKGQIVNVSQFRIQTGSEIVGLNDPQAQAGEIRNELGGWFRKMAGALTNVRTPFINSGDITFEFLGSAMNFTESLQHNSGSIQLRNGSLTVAGGLTINSGELYLGNNGLGTLTVPALTIAANARLAGVGIINGDVQNAGTIQPGFYGDLTDPPNGPIVINGDFTQVASGWLEFRLADGGLSDSLFVTGTATLNGTLSVTVHPSLNLAVDQFIDIVSANTLVGDFTTYLLPNPAIAGEWVPVITGTDLSLQLIRP